MSSSQDAAHRAPFSPVTMGSGIRTTNSSARISRRYPSSRVKTRATGSTLAVALPPSGRPVAVDPRRYAPLIAPAQRERIIPAAGSGIRSRAASVHGTGQKAAGNGINPRRSTAVDALRLTVLLPVGLSVLLTLLLFTGGFFDNLILNPGHVKVAFEHENLKPSDAVQVMKASVESPNIVTGNGDADELVFTRHRIERGETVSRIAYEYGLSPSTLISVNGLDPSDPQGLKAGTVLIIPYRDGFRTAAAEGENHLVVAARYGITSSQVQIIPGTEDYFISGADVRRQDTQTGHDEVFRYPLVGRILMAYGTGVDGLTGIPFKSEGIDLDAAIGSDVRASREGTVILTGHHSSYGRYVMMSHPGGWKSFYGHLSQIDVVPGDNLDTSDVLGISGDSGTARSPRLHFALFRDSEAVDPLDYLY